MSAITATPPTEITYHWEGDYLIPDIVISEEEANLPSLTRWGMMYKNYLKNHRKIVYNELLLAGKLFQHCHEIEEQAENRMEFMMKQLVEHHNKTENVKVTEDLKAKDPMAWVGYMNAFKAQVEEIIKAELIYV